MVGREEARVRAVAMGGAAREEGMEMEMADLVKGAGVEVALVGVAEAGAAEEAVETEVAAREAGVEAESYTHHTAQYTLTMI